MSNDFFDFDMDKLVDIAAYAIANDNKDEAAGLIEKIKAYDEKYGTTLMQKLEEKLNSYKENMERI